MARRSRPQAPRSSRPRVLLIAGDAAIGEALTPLLAEHLDVHPVPDGEVALAELPGCHGAVVALEQERGPSGLVILRRIRSQNIGLPVALVAAAAAPSPPCTPACTAHRRTSCSAIRRKRRPPASFTSCGSTRGSWSLRGSILRIRAGPSSAAAPP